SCLIGLNAQSFPATGACGRLVLQVVTPGRSAKTGYGGATGAWSVCRGATPPPSTRTRPLSSRHPRPEGMVPLDRRLSGLEASARQAFEMWASRLGRQSHVFLMT